MKAFTDANKTRLVKTGQELPETGPDPSTILIENGFEILLTKKCIKQIGNNISRVIGRQLTRGEAEELVNFIQLLPARKYVGIRYDNAQNLIAEQFLRRAQQNVREEEDVFTNVGLDRVTSGPDALHEYQKKELNLLTTDENPLKLSAHHDRRGNAIVDADRVRVAHMMGDRSSVYNVKSSGMPCSDAGGQSGSRGYEQQILDMCQLTATAMTTFNRFMNAESIENIFARSRNTWTTYESVMLPNQVVPLDSRFRLPTHTPAYQYKWYLHTAGVPGSVGDIHMKDTLKELIQMRVTPFWIPITEEINGYYDKIRMLIEEFSSQSTEFQQFLLDGTIKVKNYHFEFLITRREVGRFYLEPTNNGLFRFRKPFARPESITISFTDPFDTIVPTVDSMTAIVSNTNPAVFTTALPTDLNTGDLIYAQDFDSPSNTLNTLVNRDAGYIATKLGPDTFSIPVDLSSLAAPVLGVNVYFGSKRLIIPIEFTSLEQ